MRKLGVICIALVLALGSLGVGYAAWTDTITISGTVTTGSVEWEFEKPAYSSDPLGQNDENKFFDLKDGEYVQMDKDVATTTVELEETEHPHLMTVTIDNAYPYYFVAVDFKVHGLGSIPLRIWKVEFLVDGVVIETKTIYETDQYIYLDLDGDGADDLEIWWGDNFGDQLHESNKRDISFELLVLQPAPQDSSLSFTIELVAIQFDRYKPGPVE